MLDYQKYLEAKACVDDFDKNKLQIQSFRRERRDVILWKGGKINHTNLKSFYKHQIWACSLKINDKLIELRKVLECSYNKDQSWTADMIVDEINVFRRQRYTHQKKLILLMGEEK